MNNEEPSIHGRTRLTFKAHQAFQDYEIAFEYYRTLHERVYREGIENAAELGNAAVKLEQAHAAWRATVISS